MFEIFGRARNHGKKFPKLRQISFSVIVHSPAQGSFKYGQYISLDVYINLRILLTKNYYLTEKNVKLVE